MPNPIIDRRPPMPDHIIEQLARPYSGRNPDSVWDEYNDWRATTLNGLLDEFGRSS